MPLRIPILEPGSVTGDPQQGQGIFIAGFGLHPLLQPHDSTHLIGPPPHLDVLFSLLPELRRGPYAEHYVGKVGLFERWRLLFRRWGVVGCVTVSDGGNVGWWLITVVGVADESEGVEEVGDGD